MYIPDNYYFSDFNDYENTNNLKKKHYIGLNRTANKENKFFIQPNQLNINNYNQYQKISNNSNSMPYKNNLNKSSDINYTRVVNPSQIRQNMEKLNNKIKNLNLLYLQNNNNINLSKIKSNPLQINPNNNNFNKTKTNYTILRTQF